MLGRFAGFDLAPCIVRTPAEAASRGGRGGCRLPRRGRQALRRLADGAVPAAARTLDAWDARRAVQVLGSGSCAELPNGFQRTKLTNTRIERITGRTTTWRDLKVVRASTRDGVPDGARRPAARAGPDSATAR